VRKTLKENSLSGISTAILAVVVIILLIVVGAGVYYYTSSTVTPSTSVSTTVSTSVSTSVSLTTVTAPTTEAPVTITVWVDYTPGQAEYKAFNQTVAGFESAYPYITLNLETHDPSTQESDFETAAIANQAPDVVRGPSDWTGTFVGGGFITSLNPYVNSTFMSQYFPAAIQDFTYQGHLWGLPENINGLGLVYNKALLPNGPPTTTSQLLSECPSLTKTSASGAITQACIVFPLDS